MFTPPVLHQSVRLVDGDGGAAVGVAGEQDTDTRRRRLSVLLPPPVLHPFGLALPRLSLLLAGQCPIYMKIKVVARN